MDITNEKFCYESILFLKSQGWKVADSSYMDGGIKMERHRWVNLRYTGLYG